MLCSCGHYEDVVMVCLKGWSQLVGLTHFFVVMFLGVYCAPTVHPLTHMYMSVSMHACMLF